LRQYVGDSGHNMQPSTSGFPFGAHAPGSPQHNGKALAGGGDGCGSPMPAR